MKSNHIFSEQISSPQEVLSHNEALRKEIPLPLLLCFLFLLPGRWA